MLGARTQLVVASFLMLFVELVLIRWIGANVIYLSFFSNFVLLGSFLGIGIGFLRADRRPDLFPWAPVALASLLGIVFAFPVSILNGAPGVAFTGALRASGPPAWLILPVIFLAVAGVMAAIAHGVAVRFAKFEALDAYRLDVVGSLLGIAAYAGLSALSAPPLAWAAVIVTVFVLLLDRIRLRQAAALAAIAVLFAIGTFKGDVVWSPYYRIEVKPLRGLPGVPDLPHVFVVYVNRAPHQSVMPNRTRRRFEPLYFTPYERAPNNSLRDVLIVGAGTGSDVAIALQQGAEHIDAVEIDPELFDIGERLHPEHPYASPRVTQIVNDGRAFLENTDHRYDLILFALPDSLTLVGGQSGVRLESFLFTEEAIEAAREHLAPDGTFAMYNYYRTAWLVDRLAGTVTDVFGEPPCLDTASPVKTVRAIGGLSVITAGMQQGDVSCSSTWDPATRPAVAPATDDHPFPYLLSRSIPAKYVLELALVLGASALLVHKGAAPFRSMVGWLDLFFMGAAFLLIESQTVVRFALLFGTTWIVNAIVFAGILVSVLAALEVERRWRIGRPALLFVLLAGSLAIAAVVAPSLLLTLPMSVRAVAGSVIAFTPVFIANIVFAERFREAANAPAAFGANLIGAMVGGVLEYLALVTGYRALLLVAGLLYALAFLARPRATRVA